MREGAVLARGGELKEWQGWIVPQGVVSRGRPGIGIELEQV